MSVEPRSSSLLSGFVPREGARRDAGEVATLRFPPEALARFNAVMQQIAPGARALDASQLAAAARRMLFTGARARGSDAIARRVARVQTLEAMRADAGFALDAGLAQRIALLLEYVANADDLIPDDTPVVGLLDDAVLIDLMLRAAGPELEDYGDFCAFRRAAAERAGVAPESLGLDVRDWIALRRRELAAHRAQRREGYAGTPAGPAFRVR